MSGTPTLTSRRPRRLVAICSLIGGLLAAWLAYEFWTRRSTEQRYRDAVAEADRQSPTWREGTLAEAPRKYRTTKTRRFWCYPRTRRSPAAGKRSRVSGRRSSSNRVSPWNRRRSSRSSSRARRPRMPSPMRVR